MLVSTAAAAAAGGAADDGAVLRGARESEVPHS